MAFDALLRNLLQQDAFDAHETASQLSAIVQQEPALAEAFPADYAMTIFHKAKASKDDLHRIFWLQILLIVVDCAPRLALPLLASDEPNASFTILSDLTRIGRAADTILQQELLDALLTLMNDSRPEMRVDSRVRIAGSLDHDSRDERLKFRIAAAQALIQIAPDWGRHSLSTIASGLLAICKEPSSIYCSRAAIFASAVIPLDAVTTFKCVSIGLDSTDMGVLKETGLAIARSASRIRHVWPSSATNSIVEKLGVQSWIARNALTEALLTLVVQGSQPPSADVYALILRLCESHELFRAMRAAESQLGDPEAARLVREARELDAGVRSGLYQTAHHMLPTLEGNLIEDVALFAGDVLENKHFDATKIGQIADDIKFDSPELWEPHLTMLLDECLRIIELRDKD